MPKAKPFTKEEIITAMKHSKSVRAAARYLRCSYQHLKPYMKMFIDEETGKSLFDLHKNRQGKGIPKYLPNRRKEPNLKIIVTENRGWESFSPEKLKIRLIAEGYLKHECYKCGFSEARVLDYKIPILLNFKDGDKQNHILNNLELVCYNCYFLYIADPLNLNQKRSIESSSPVKEKSFDWELDPKLLENMLLMGQASNDEDDEYQYVTRKD